MDDSRREFLKKAGYASLGIGLGLPLTGKIAGASGGHQVPLTTQLGMVIDIKKCENEKLARACMDACRIEHNIPLIEDPKEEVKWLWTESFKDLFPDQTHSRSSDQMKNTSVFALCNQCARPSCVKVCPTGATWKRKSDGIVMMDMHRCIGCRYCMAACPYSARSFNFRDPRLFIQGGDESKWTDYPTRTKGVVEKCNFCGERLREGLLPACVEAANAITPGALTFGDLSDPHSEISGILEKEHTICRRIGMGTGPSVFYII